MNELKNYLKQFDLFDDNELDQSLSCFKKIVIPKGEHYLKENDVCKKLAFVSKGLFRLYYTIDGVERNKLFFQEYQFVTDFYSWLTETPSQRPIQAIENSTIYSVSKTDFEKLLASSPKWERLGRLLAERAYIVSVHQANRVIHDDPDTRFMTFLKEFPTLLQRVPQYMIASYLNMTPETYSRVKKRTIKQSTEDFSPVHKALTDNFI